MSRKSTISALFTAKPSSPSGHPALDVERAPEVKSNETNGLTGLGSPNPPANTRVRSGAIGAMGASLQQFQDAAREADDLRAKLASGDLVQDIDPALIDASAINDRLGQAFDPAHEALKVSIFDHGQQVPVLLRPHPQRAGRYQIAYGHRRVRALREIGRPVKAQVRALSDAELVIAQGKENGERRDLSYIERAYFAANLAAGGFERSVIMAALTIDKSDLSRLLSIGAAVPAHLLQAIGPASKAGRPRWAQLVEALKRPGADDRCRNVMLRDSFSQADTDQRFRMMLDAALGSVSMRSKDALARILLKSENGAPVVKTAKMAAGIRFEIDERAAPAFSQFLAERLPALYADYQTSTAPKKRR